MSGAGIMDLHILKSGNEWGEREVNDFFIVVHVYTDVSESEAK
jgi:hypothetical protein